MREAFEAEHHRYEACELKVARFHQSRLRVPHVVGALHRDPWIGAGPAHLPRLAAISGATRRLAATARSGRSAT